MKGTRVEELSTTPGLPISPSLGDDARNAHIKNTGKPLDLRTLQVTAVSIVIATITMGVAKLLVQLIAFITNLAFFGELSAAARSPATNTLGGWVVFIPMIGALVVGLMARFGSKAIRGHGIPEAMEQILLNESKIPRRLTFLKPISAAVAIGTGGPFGAEGPIIATGGALGSWVGQIIKTTSAERKVLLAAGAASGMTAIFGSPVSAILLAIELLLFEFKPRSYVPVGVAAITVMALRSFFFGNAPMFAMGDLPVAATGDILFYMTEGIFMGLLAVFLTKSVYFIEDVFEKLPIHWMWWPLIGGVFVGAIGFFAPTTLGVGYDNIDQILSGHFLGCALLFFSVLKFLSWSLALGSGTSGGTLAPIFTIGGGFGVLYGSLFTKFNLGSPVDLRVAALVGMASCFAGSSRALFTSVIFAFETTRQPNGLVPLLVGCIFAYLISSLTMKHSIMTEKLARRGHHVPTEYSAAH